MRVRSACGTALLKIFALLAAALSPIPATPEEWLCGCSERMVRASFPGMFLFDNPVRVAALRSVYRRIHTALKYFTLPAVRLFGDHETCFRLAVFVKDFNATPSLYNHRDSRAVVPCAIVTLSNQKREIRF